ncbi:prolactin regulatory element-binding protein [Plakobranchus ocellatus]|uniref:Prolactin regulatory element-binding protein n=1 Tax=Plakobranchus ocellatus TaxID=259542 RepID=A0AAV3ZPG7_9GAST|nr:prolactin regulatory element-binding protein [Plakobranchus ocellatus]
MAPPKGVLLAHTDFPLYTVRALDDKHFIVAGGGGQAKTGIPNAIEIYKISPSSSGGEISATSVCRHDTGIRAVMNCSSFYDGRHHHLATGEDELCGTYTVKYKVVSQPEGAKAKSDNVRHRKPNDAGSENADKKESKSDSVKKELIFQIEEAKSVTTDFSSDGGFQKCVRFAPKYSSLATGGADGFVRLWKYPELTKLWEVQAHKNEIDDIDFSPDGSKVVTVSRDKNGSVWSVKDGKKVIDLVWNQKTTDPYRFRACRFGLIEGKKDKFNLYSVNIPVTRSSSNHCFISLWDASKFALKKTVRAGPDVISALAVSPEGIFLGVGTISGSISVYITFSLQRLYHVKEAHSIFVTGLDFLPASEATRAVTGDHNYNLVSISADNMIRLHQSPERSSYHPVLIIIGVFVIVFLMFYLMAELGI